MRGPRYNGRNRKLRGEWKDGETTCTKRTQGSVLFGFRAVNPQMMGPGKSGASDHDSVVIGAIFSGPNATIKRMLLSVWEKTDG